MAMLDTFAVIVLLILVIAAIVIWVVLAMLPGKIARKRNHPQADAINVGGWLGALLGGVLWPIFLIWAYTKPVRIAQVGSDPSESDALRKRVEALEAKLAAAEGRRT